MISLCLTTYNRYEMLFEAFESLINDARVGEIVISDDCSEYNIFSLVQKKADSIPKVKLFRNVCNSGMSINKAIAIRLAVNDWCLLADDDNIFDSSYLNALPHTLHSDIIYCPAFARPEFDYRKYAGMTLDKHNIARLLQMNEPMINCLLNTCNYVVHRQAYLVAYKLDPAHIASDTIWFNYNWLKEGGRFYIVPGMEYTHRVHAGSGFKKQIDYNMQKVEEVRAMIMQLS